MANVMPRIADMLAERASAGVQVRLCWGDPTSAAVDIRDREEGLRGALPHKIRAALTYYRSLVDVPGCEVRLHGTTLYASLFRFDDVMLANPHMWGAPASANPLLQLRRLEGSTWFDGYRRSFDAVWETAQPWDPRRRSAASRLRSLGRSVDENAGPGTTSGALAFRTDAVVRSRLDRHVGEIHPQRLGQVLAHGLDVRPQSDCAKRDETVDVSYGVATLGKVAGELLDKAETPRVDRLGVVLRKVRSQVPISDCAGQCVQQSVAQDVAIGVGVKADVGRNGHAAEHQGTIGHEAVNVVPDADPQ